MQKIIVGLLAVLALFYLAAGVSLYFFSQSTFESLPSYYGVFNAHFVKDAGLAFSSSGILLALAVLSTKYRLQYAFSASLFVVFHGLFHVQMLATGMVPEGYTGYELLQIVMPASVLLVLVGVLYANQRAQ